MWFALRKSFLSPFQNLNQDLDEMIEERENLKLQVQDYVTEVRRVEDILAAKVCTQS